MISDKFMFKALLFAQNPFFVLIKCLTAQTTVNQVFCYIKPNISEFIAYFI